MSLNKATTSLKPSYAKCSAALAQRKFIYFIESKVEDDLSWIRINGAIVGAVAGLLVWTFLEYVYMPFWQQFVG